MIASIVLGLDALVFLGLGIALLIKPLPLLESVAVRPVSPTGLVELRAMYGGLEIGLGIFCILGLVFPGWLAPALAMNILVLGGLGLVRFIGICVHANKLILWKLFGSEAIAVLLNGVALYLAI